VKTGSGIGSNPGEQQVIPVLDFFTKMDNMQHIEYFFSGVEC